MNQVHPSAIVGEDVKLAEGVKVGPWCVLEGRISLGEATELLHGVTLRGPLTVGRGNVFYPNACIGYAPQDRKFDPHIDGAGVVIGDENTFREGVTVHRATKENPTKVGHRNYLMVNAHVGHDTVVGDDVTMANGALLGGHVEVGDRAILGGNAAVHQFCRVGRFAMLSGAECVTQDLPSFCVAHKSKEVGSLNIIGLRRSGLGGHLKYLKRAFDLLYRSRLAMPTAVGRILAELGDDVLCVELAEFVRGSKRGLTPYGGRRGDVTESPAVELQV